MVNTDNLSLNGFKLKKKTWAGTLVGPWLPLGKLALYYIIFCGLN